MALLALSAVVPLGQPILLWVPTSKNASSSASNPNHVLGDLEHAAEPSSKPLRRRRERLSREPNVILVYRPP